MTTGEARRVGVAMERIVDYMLAYSGISVYGVVGVYVCVCSVYVNAEHCVYANISEITVKVRNGVRRQDIQRIRHRLDITCQVKDVF